MEWILQVPVVVASVVFTQRSARLGQVAEGKPLGEFKVFQVTLSTSGFHHQLDGAGTVGTSMEKVFHSGLKITDGFLLLLFLEVLGMLRSRQKVVPDILPFIGGCLVPLCPKVRCWAEASGFLMEVGNNRGIVGVPHALLRCFGCIHHGMECTGATGCGNPLASVVWMQRKKSRQGRIRASDVQCYGNHSTLDGEDGNHPLRLYQSSNTMYSAG